MESQPLSLFQSVILGIVQGLTEFLPISSSAHMRVVPAALGWQDPGVAFSASIQLGSVLAVLVYFFNDLKTIVSGAFGAVMRKDFKDHNFLLLMGIIIGTMPICVLGLLLKHTLESDSSPLRSLHTVGIVSIVMGILLMVAELVGKKMSRLNLSDLGIKHGLFVGMGQALALFPGASRSGSTLTVALLLGLKREDAARFSFLLGIPAILLSGLLELKELVEAKQAGMHIGMTEMAGGLVSSTIVSFLAIYWLIKFLQKHSTICFVVYRMLFGAYALYLASTVK